MNTKEGDIQTENTIYEYIMRWRNSDRIAVEYEKNKQKISVTYKEFLTQVKNVVIQLNNHGKYIGIIASNSYEYVVLATSIICSGGSHILVPFDNTLPIDDIENQIKLVGIDELFFSTKTNKKNIELLIKKQNISCYPIEETIESMSRIYEEDKKLLKENPQDISMLLFTSGTSDKSKIVTITYKNIVSSYTAALTDFPNKERELKQDYYLLMTPLYHTAGLRGTLLIAFVGGGVLCIGRGRLHIFEDFSYYNPTVVMGIPEVAKNLIQLRNMGKTKKEVYGNRLVLFACGAAPLKSEIQDQIRKDGIAIANGYGMTECISIAANYDSKEGEMKISEGVLVKLEKDSKEILVKSDRLTPGYYLDEELNKKAFTDGWFHTGDIGELTAEGKLIVKGRLKEMIVLESGQKVFPVELEQVLEQNKHIKECQVYMKKELSVLAVMEGDLPLEEQNKQLKQIIQEFNHKQPFWRQIINYNCMEEIPKNSMGKIRRFNITEE